VIDPPQQATTVGSTDFCQHAVLSYGKKALSVQPHPEFNNAYTHDLVITRREVIANDELVDYALKHSDAPLSQQYWAERFRNFFTGNAT